LEDALKPFSKTNTYKGITSLHVLLASSGFVVVSKAQQTMFFPKCHFLWSWGKMISLMTLTNPVTAEYLMPVPTPHMHSQALSIGKTSSSAAF